SVSDQAAPSISWYWPSARWNWRRWRCCRCRMNSRLSTSLRTKNPGAHHDILALTRQSSDIERPVAEEETKTQDDEPRLAASETDVIDGDGQGEERPDDAVDASSAAEEPQNRRARRAAASQARKARMRERREAEAVGLGAQELLDDALVRSTDTAAKWLRRNSAILQWTLVIGLVSWAGWGIYGWRAASKKAAASDALALAVEAERGKIGDPAEQGRPNEQGVVDPTPIFEDKDER